MELAILLGLVFMVSIIGSVMTPIQAKTGQLLGFIWATTAYLVVGALAGLIILLFRQEHHQVERFISLPFYVYLNGIFNILVLVSIVALVPKVGIGTAWASGVIGRFSSSILFDHFGLFGLEIDQITILKVIGTILIITGALIFTKKQQMPTKQLNHQSQGFVIEKDPETADKWPRWIGIGLGITIGASQPMMTAINSSAGKLVGVMGSVTIYLGIGAIVALLISLWMEPRKITQTMKLPVYHYFPGLINVLFVGLHIILIPIIGVGLFTGIGFFSSAFSSMIFDSMGLFGMPKTHITGLRVISVAVMLTGVLLLRN